MRAVVAALAVAGCGFQPTQSGPGPLEAGTVSDAPDAMIDALPDDLIAWYRMDEDALPIADATGHGHDGTCVACPVASEGVVNGGLRFMNARVDVTSTPELEQAEGTVMAWMEFETTGPGYVCPFGKIFMQPMNLNSWQVCLYQSSIWQVFVQPATGGPVSFTAGAQITLGQWQHVALTWTASSSELFIDGASQGVIAVVGGMKFDHAIMTIGGDRNNPNTLDVPINGRMDEMKLFGRALSVAEISALAQR